MIWYMLWLLIFVVVILAIGFYHYRRVSGVDSYLLAERSVTFWPLVGTTIATWCGAAVFIGLVGLGYNIGLSGFFGFALPAALFSILLCLIFARRLRRTKLYTLPDLFDERFGTPAGLLPAILIALVYSVPTLALQFVALGLLFKAVFGLPLVWGLILAVLITYVYTMLGGFRSVITTDAIQSVILLIGIVLMTAAVWAYAGGSQAVTGTLPGSHLRVLGANPILTLITALSVGPFYLVWQPTWQRIYAAKTEKVAQWGSITGFLIGGMVISALPVLIGIKARLFIPNAGATPDAVFYLVLRDVLPPYLGGILVIGLVAAVVSSGDSFIIQAGANLTRDIFQRYYRPDATSVQLLRVSRWGVSVITILGLLVSFTVKDIITIYSYALKWSGTTLVLPFLAVMFWRRATRTGVIGSMMLALGSMIVWEFAGRPLGISEVFIGYGASAALLTILSLLTRHAPGEQVVALWWDSLGSKVRHHTKRNADISETM